MIVSRWIAWTILLASVLTAGILTQFHSRIPTSPFLPLPIGSLLFFLVLILFLAFARGWGPRQEIPYAGSGLRRVNLLAVLPFVLALMLRQWVTITLLDPLFSRIDDSSMPPEKFNALYLAAAGLVLLALSVALLPLFRRLWPLLVNFLKSKRVPIAALGLAIAMAALYGGLGLVLRLGGGENVALRWVGFGRFSALVVSAQALIAFAEELFYRGILQDELAFLLPAFGLTRDRVRYGGAIGLVSISFALEHFSGWGAGRHDLQRFLFTLASSLFLGVLLVLMENLWFCAGCHFLLNLFVLGAETGRAGAGLQFVDLTGKPLFDPSIYVFLFFIFAFVVAYCRHALYAKIYRRRRRPSPA